MSDFSVWLVREMLCVLDWRRNHNREGMVNERQHGIVEDTVDGASAGSMDSRSDGTKNEASLDRLDRALDELFLGRPDGRSDGSTKRDVACKSDGTSTG